MKIKNVMRDAMIIALILFGVQWLQMSFLSSALIKEDHAAMSRLEAGVADVLNKAHEAKDDLTIYQVLHSLSETPGIIQAHIADPARKPGLYVYPLEDKDQKWGYLSLAISKHLFHQLIRRQWMVGLMVSVLIWGAFFFYIRFFDQKIKSFQTQVSELEQILEAERRRLSHAQENLKETVSQAAARLQKTVEFIPLRTIILDAQQKVVAAKPAILFQKSWHEISDLSSCGTILEQSLSAPGQPLVAFNKTGDRKLIFESNSLGTWITFVESKE